jgi:predicted  nucleic acid-binding Zn-ribbon protein
MTEEELRTIKYAAAPTFKGIQALVAEVERLNRTISFQEQSIVKHKTMLDNLTAKIERWQEKYDTVVQTAWTREKNLKAEIDRLREVERIAYDALSRIAQCGCSACGPMLSSLREARVLADDAMTQMSVVE